MRYTHYLITSTLRKRQTPMVLVPNTTPLSRLRTLALAEVERRAELLVPATSDTLVKLRRLSDGYFVAVATSLWLEEVRLSHTPGMAIADETATVWWLSGGRGVPEPWQGPADGVIPPETPVTISRGWPSRFVVID